ncbi:transmembrane GTPase fzo1 [Macrolepiota fuliginosa MF-IS2]|uniref:Transmembrane GTPase fzo1 n=1 Tax=Macrolepiota fuliginosa MF-IS2 TaxID=1400762 RepID=A0A9P5XLP8_9AGAR|nr:transmembrane GTPase fzo1 [Macrolepiota fuliginosa MF-IS2]
MAQSIFPSQDGALQGLQLKVDDVQEAYIEQKDRLLNAINSTKTVLSEIRTFNKDEWVVRYPQLREQPSANSEPAAPKRRAVPRRSLSFADDPSFETEVVVSQKPGVNRRITLSSLQDVQEDEDPEAAENPDDGDRLISSAEFNVLKLDLKLGSHSSSTAASLVHQLEKSSIANLLDDRIGSSMTHIDKLRLRVEDTSSKVLVTGDLNAGKSTFVNALLRREVMPVDQQPCTTAFCEVHDAAENDGKEEVHVLKEGVQYNILDESTYTKGSIASLEEIVADNESADQMMIKVYLADTRAPSESLLNNGVVDISLIDAPGLNRDSIKTTAVFARQEEIDVVVFVVSAENHFTLSAKEFLHNASNEKAYLFIVVNKYDQIKNKEKCRRLVLDQIKALSPRTYEDAEDLVHFVDSAAALQPYTANPAFDDLESALRSFVLVKRSKSKLQPVTTYLHNILSDVELLSGANAIVADSEADKARLDLSQSRPVLEKLKSSREVVEDTLESAEEEGTTQATTRTKVILSDALDRVAQGQLGVPAAHTSVVLPTYPGFLGIWDYARDVRKALVASIDAAVKLAEDEARVITSSGVDKIKALGETHLPEGVERSRRVFIPEAMFSVHRRGVKGTKQRRSTTGGSAIVAGGTQGLGIGLALSSRPELLETTFLDLFDVNNQFLIYFHPTSSSSGKHQSSLDFIDEDEDDNGPSPTALSVASLGLGALTMVGGQAIGARGIIEGILRLGEVFSNESSRKWVAPVLGAATIGFGVYLVWELPNSVPRTVGRRVRAQVLRAHRRQEESVVEVYVRGGRSGHAGHGSGNGFVEGHAERVGRETRKVLRLAAWDLRERFRGALEECSKEVRGSEEMEKRAVRAKEWFEGVMEKAEGIRKEGGLEALLVA